MNCGLVKMVSWGKIVNVGNCKLGKILTQGKLWKKCNLYKIENSDKL